MPIELLRLPNVLKARGRGRSAHYQDIHRKLFTRPVLIGGRAVAWPAYELEAINAARIAGQSDEDIRRLVARLETARKALAQ